jgi:hypothetical protein
MSQHKNLKEGPQRRKSYVLPSWKLKEEALNTTGQNVPS